MRKVRGNQKESRWAVITKGLGKWVGNKVGDIIVFKNPPKGEVITAHRVIEVRQGKLPSFRAKGNAVEEADEHMGFGLFVGLPATLIIGIEARNIFSLPEGKASNQS